MYTLNLTM